MRRSGILLLGEELYSKKLQHVTFAKPLEKPTVSSGGLHHSKTASSVLGVTYKQNHDLHRQLPEVKLKNYVGCTVT
jgi:hypothetical protein